MGKVGLAVLCKHDVAVVSLVGKVTAWHVLFLGFLMDSVFIFGCHHRFGSVSVYF